MAETEEKDRSQGLQRMTERSRKVRDQIEASRARAREEHRRELFRKRIDLARQGVRNYEGKRVAEAVRAFHTYLSILEDWKQVAEGGLHPGLFDKQKDIPELLLISGVYWDLVKLYDRTKSGEKEKDFRNYLAKYVLFAKGMPYQAVAGETLRKYLSIHDPVHRSDFKAAYQQIALTKCYVATALVDVCDESTIVLLRRFRDRTLMRSPAGRIAVHLYYLLGPIAAWGTDRFPDGFRSRLGRTLDGFARWLARR